MSLSQRHGLHEVIEIYQAAIAEVKKDGINGLNQVCDAINLPQGSLQVIMNPFYELFPQQTFASYIPLDSTQAPGASRLTYPRVSFDGTSEIGQVGSNYRRTLDTNIEPVEYPVIRDKAQIVIDRFDEERINLAVSRGNLIGGINLFATKMRGAAENSAKVRDELISLGRPDIGVLGMLSHPDIITVTLGELFPSTNPSYNLAVLKTAIAEIVRLTNGTLSPTTLWLPPSDFTTLNNQDRAGTELTTLQFFGKNQPAVVLDDGQSHPFEISQSARLENCYGQNAHAMLAFCRRMDCVSQVLPMPMTPQAPVTNTEGYVVPLDADYAGAQIKQPNSIIVFRYSRL